MSNQSGFKSDEERARRVREDVLIGPWFSSGSPGRTAATFISPHILWAEESEIAEALEQLAADGLVEGSEPGGDIADPLYRVLPLGLAARERVFHSRGWRKQCLLRQREYPVDDLVVALVISPRIENARITGAYRGRSEEVSTAELTTYLFLRDPTEVAQAAEDLAARGLLIARRERGESFYVATSSGEREYAKRIRASLGLKEGEAVLDEVHKDALRIFYAWQSDHGPSRRHLEEALRRIVTDANATWSPVASIVVELATDPGDGAVRIDTLLMEKIARADVVVADITPVATYENRLVPNPNILIEVGYALAGKEAEQVVLVEHSVKTNEWLAANPGARLPFDIDHVRRIAYGAPSQLRQRLETEIRTVLGRRGYVTR
jgi:hypothetical protein